MHGSFAQIECTAALRMHVIALPLVMPSLIFFMSVMSVFRDDARN